MLSWIIKQSCWNTRERVYLPRRATQTHFMNNLPSNTQNTLKTAKNAQYDNVVLLLRKSVFGNRDKVMNKPCESEYHKKYAHSIQGDKSMLVAYKVSTTKKPKPCQSEYETMPKWVWNHAKVSMIFSLQSAENPDKYWLFCTFYFFRIFIYILYSLYPQEGNTYIHKI